MSRLSVTGLILLSSLLVTSHAKAAQTFSLHFKYDECYPAHPTDVDYEPDFYDTTYISVIDGLLSDRDQPYLNKIQQQNLRNLVEECRLFDYPKHDARWWRNEEINYRRLTLEGFAIAQPIWRELQSLHAEYLRAHPAKLAR